MRWKLIRRRFSISAPRVIVRSHLPWPVRWALLAIIMGFLAALALWAFEVGREWSGWHRSDRDELSQLRQELTTLREAHQAAQTVASSADTILKAEKTTREHLQARIKGLEKQNSDLLRDVLLFEKLSPNRPGAKSVAVRGLFASPSAPGKLQFQALLTRTDASKSGGPWSGRYEISLSGTLQGEPYRLSAAGGSRTLSFQDVQRLEGVVEFPPQAQIDKLDIKIVEASGAVVATEMTSL